MDASRAFHLLCRGHHLSEHPIDQMEILQVLQTKDKQYRVENMNKLRHGCLFMTLSLLIII